MIGLNAFGAQYVSQVSVWDLASESRLTQTLDKVYRVIEKDVNELLQDQLRRIAIEHLEYRGSPIQSNQLAELEIELNPQKITGYAFQNFIDALIDEFSNTLQRFNYRQVISEFIQKIK